VEVFCPVAREQLCPVRGDAFCRALANCAKVSGKRDPRSTGNSPERKRNTGA